MIYSQMLKGSQEDYPKGSLPQINSQVITPKDQRSTWKLYPFPVTISGAIQWGVPIIVLVLNLRSILSFLAVPISTKVRNPLTFIIRFQGFRSRYMILLEWRCSIMSKIWAVSCRACQEVNVTTFVMTSKRSSPQMNQRMKQMKLESFISLWKPTTNGNLGTVRRIYSSFIMYWIICDFQTQARSSTLIAYIFQVLLFQHAYTFPKLPSLSLRTTWKSAICIFFSRTVLSSPSPLFTRMAIGEGATSISYCNLPIMPSYDATMSYRIFICFLSSSQLTYTIPLGWQQTACPFSYVFKRTQIQPLCSLPFLNTVSPFLKLRKSHVSVAYFSFLGSKSSYSLDSLTIFQTTFLFITFFRLSPRLLLTFQRLIEMIMHFVLAIKVLVRIPPQTRIEFSPKQSISFSQWFFSLMRTVPSLMTQKELASSP